MRTLDKWTSREYEPMRHKLIEHGKMLCIVDGTSYYMWHGTIYADNAWSLHTCGPSIEVAPTIGAYMDVINYQYEDAINELEDEARELEQWPRGTGVYRLPSGQYVAASEFERVASRVTGGLDGLLLVANGELTRSEVETHVDELEAMAAAVCEDADAVCYYTEADY